MASYRVLTKSYIGNRIVNEGEVVEYDGVPGDNLEPSDKAAKAAAAESANANAESLARQKVAAAGNDPNAIDTVAATNAAVKAIEAVTA